MDFDSVVIGAGVIGLSVARALALSGRETLLLERHSRIAEETSSRNSEVIHAGIYYPRASQKAKLCVSGRKLLYQYCESRKVPYKKIGKLIVATCPPQVEKLRALLDCGVANGVVDLRMVAREELHLLEPQLNAVAAVFSPSTGIIDSHALMLALQGDMESAGGLLCVNSPVEELKRISTGFDIRVGGSEPVSVSASEVVNCAGLSAQEVSYRLANLDRTVVPRRYLSKGCYFSSSTPVPFSHLIYPVPSNEGLGIHLTVDMAGSARFGPDTEWVDQIDYRIDEAKKEQFCSAIKRYYPELPDGSLQPAYAGIRPKVTGPGQEAGDFVIHDHSQHGVPGYIALYGIESPGLTSCLSIAEYVMSKLDCRVAA